MEDELIESVSPPRKPATLSPAVISLPQEGQGNCEPSTSSGASYGTPHSLQANWGIFGLSIRPFRPPQIPGGIHAHYAGKDGRRVSLHQGKTGCTGLCRESSANLPASMIRGPSSRVRSASRRERQGAPGACILAPTAGRSGIGIVRLRRRVCFASGELYSCA